MKTDEFPRLLSSSASSRCSSDDADRTSRFAMSPSPHFALARPSPIGRSRSRRRASTPPRYSRKKRDTRRTPPFISDRTARNGLSVRSVRTSRPTRAVDLQSIGPHRLEHSGQSDLADESQPPILNPTTIAARRGSLPEDLFGTNPSGSPLRKS